MPGILKNAPTAVSAAKIAARIISLSGTRLLAAPAAALAVLYLCGLPYLYIKMNGVLSVWKTVWSGCLIFLPYDAVKMVLASLLAVRLHKTGLVGKK